MGVTGRCIGYPRLSCHSTNEYAKAKARAWMCTKCREKRNRAWKVKHT